MRKICWISFLAVGLGSGSLAQTSPPQPQSARQALIEMFLGTASDAFEKHLPDATRHKLIHKGESPEISIVQRIASMGRQATRSGTKFETFDVGSTLLISQDSSGERTEINVESDSLSGDTDEIELSVRVYRNGQPEFLPVVPRASFSFQQENEIWRLTDVSVSLHAPLTDPDYLSWPSQGAG